MARRTFHVRGLSLYLVGMVAVRGLASFWSGAGLWASVGAMLWVLPLAAACIGILWLLAYAHACTTVYTITNRRVVLRYGVALNMAVNLPFAKVRSAAMRPVGDLADVPLQMEGPGHLAYLHLWPHARPWKFSPTQPMLRAIPKEAAQILARALVHYGTDEVPVEVTQRPEQRPEKRPEPARVPQLAAAGAE